MIFFPESAIQRRSPLLSLSSVRMDPEAAGIMPVKNVMSESVRGGASGSEIKKSQKFYFTS